MPDIEDIYRYYNQGREQTRLTGRATGQLEQLRTQELILLYLPDESVTVLDVGGGAGVYALWLAQLGHSVHLVDLIPLHIEQALAAANTQPDYPLASARVGDARQLDFPDASVEAVLLLGPLYHLQDRADRLQVLQETYRVLKPGGLVFAVAISRFASMMEAIHRGYLLDPGFAELVSNDLDNGKHHNPTGQQGYFTTAYFHHPTELPAEVSESGFAVENTLVIEGSAAFAPELDTLWADDQAREALLQYLQTIESDPAILGATGHLMSIGRKT